MDRYNISGRFLRHGLVAGMLMFAALPTHAASVSFFLDQSNILPDGTNYPQLETLTIPSSNVQVVINNSDFQKVSM